MRVGMLMGVYQVAVAMGMAVDVRVHMAVLHGYGVLSQQHRRNRHNDQAHIKLHTRPLSQQEHAQHRAKERRDGIKRAGFGRAQIFLRPDIEVDTQAIGHKAQEHDHRDPPKRREAFAAYQRNSQAADAAENALDRRDLDRGSAAELPGAVILQAPAARSRQYQQGAFIELEAPLPLKAQHNARDGHQRNCRNQPPGQGFFEYKGCDQRGRNDLKIIQQ